MFRNLFKKQRIIDVWLALGSSNLSKAELGRLPLSFTVCRSAYPIAALAGGATPAGVGAGPPPTVVAGGG